MKLRLHQFEYSCKNCGDRFLANQLHGDFVYGEFLLRSEGIDNPAYLNSFEDKVFDELSNLIDHIDFLKIKNEKEKTAIFQKLYGITCDPDLDNSLFQMGLNPKCTHCGKREIAWFQSTQPPVLIDQDIPHVKHEKWNAMSQSEKEMLINEELKKFNLA